jgi:hypothetical protein
MGIAELLHKFAPFLPIGYVAIAFVIYSSLFHLAVRRSGGDPKELGALIPISFGLLAIPIGYVIWKAWFSGAAAY